MLLSDDVPNPSWFGEMDIWLMMETIRSNPNSIDPNAINHVDNSGMTPLLKAIAGNKPDLVRWLLDHGADINPRISSLVVLARSKDDEFSSLGSMTGVSESIIEAVYKVDNVRREQEHSIKLLIASLLIARGAKVYFSSLSPLHYALKRGDAKLAHLLLDNGAWSGKPHPKSYRPMMLNAASLKDLTVLERMLQDHTELLKIYGPLPEMTGSNWNLKAVEMLAKAKSPITDKLIFGSIRSCNTPALEIFLRYGGDPNAVTENQNSALIVASIQGCSSALKVLIEAGARIEHVNRFNMTALHLVTNTCSAKILLASGANIEAIDHLGQTPIFVVGDDIDEISPWKMEESPAYHTPTGRVKTVTDVFIDKGADINHLDDKGRTPMIWATITGDIGAVRRLSKAGAIHQSDYSDRNPLLYATMLKNPALAKYLVPFENVNQADINGDTPLMWATEQGMEDIARQLLKHGAFIDAQDREGHTALMRAADRDNVKILTMLMKEKANIDLQDEEGMTALLWVVRLGRENAIHHLLKHGADPKMKDHQGRNALTWAKLKRRDSLIDIFSPKEDV